MFILRLLTPSDTSRGSCPHIQLRYQRQYLGRLSTYQAIKQKSIIDLYIFVCLVLTSQHKNYCTETRTRTGPRILKADGFKPKTGRI